MAREQTIRPRAAAVTSEKKKENGGEAKEKGGKVSGSSPKSQ